MFGAGLRAKGESTRLERAWLLAEKWGMEVAEEGKADWTGPKLGERVEPPGECCL